MGLRLVISIVTAISLLAIVLPASPAVASNEAPVLAMYYAWFDQNSWGPDKMADQPASPYVSADRGTIERQVNQAKSAGIDGFELNWWGPGNPTDSNLQTLLDVARGRDFKVSIDFDLNSPFVHNPGDVTNYLNYAKRYFGDPAWFRYNGKPVVVFYGIRKYDVNTWGTIRNQVDPAHEAIWIGEGDIFTYLNVFDGIHPYSVAWSSDPSRQLASYARKTRAYPGKLWMATVMPGYDDTRLGRPNGFRVDRQGGDYYRRLWQGAIATSPAIISITSWNEWPEGSQIEPSASYGDLYLNITREMSAAYHQAMTSATAAQVPATQLSTANGAYFTEAGEGKGGYWISNEGGMTFYDSFQAFGGVAALGYPASQRFERDGLIYQATQGAVLQWRPDYGRAILANTFEWFTEAGHDDWLLQNAGIPKPIRDDGSNGDWQRAKEIRLSWLTDERIRQKYLEAGSLERAIELYGLPMSRPEQHGPFVVQRFQRIAFQRWVESVPGMPAPGSVVRVLGGDLMKQLGMIPEAATQPTAR